MKSLLFSTGNSNKFKVGQHICQQYDIQLEQKDAAADEVQGEDLEYVATRKAQAAYEVLKAPVIISDDSWEIPGLKGFPGPYMHSMNLWLSPEDFLRLTLPLKDRRIFQHKHLVFCDGSDIKIFIATYEGILTKEIRGTSADSSLTITQMKGDNGLTIAEMYNQNKNMLVRDTTKIWHDFTKWYTTKN